MVGDAMPIPTEPIGSIPRPADLIAAWADRQAGRISVERSTRSRSTRCETRSGDSRRPAPPSSLTASRPNRVSPPTRSTAPRASLADGVVVPFDDGHTRQLPRLWPGRFVRHARVDISRGGEAADDVAGQAGRDLRVGVEPALSRRRDSRDIRARRSSQTWSSEAAADIRQCLDRGADSVQIDFTEGRLSLKLDPSGGLLEQFVALEQSRARSVLAAGAASNRRSHVSGRRSGCHAQRRCRLCRPAAGAVSASRGRFYIQLASEPDPKRVLDIIREHRQPDQIVFVGVTDPINPDCRNGGAGA